MLLLERDLFLFEVKTRQKENAEMKKLEKCTRLIEMMNFEEIFYIY